MRIASRYSVILAALAFGGACGDAKTTAPATTETKTETQTVTETTVATGTDTGTQTITISSTVTVTSVGTGTATGLMGPTDFTAEEPTSSSSTQGAGGASASNGMGGATSVPVLDATPSGTTSTATTTEAAPVAPGGRVAEVEEADIYRVDQDRLFYFNTYRGFLIFDVRDPKSPKPISRLPVYGYPVEMFIKDTTVYALIRDALYLTQANGKMQFERRNVSQLVTIDISDLANPKIIQTVDIIGQLREGVSRKVDDTIYVVSYIPRYYNYGWSYMTSNQAQKEQAWVYSFDVSDPKAPKKVGELQIFEGGSVSTSENGYSYNKSFQSVAISATSNALMVVENWYVSSYTSVAGTGTTVGTTRTCGAYDSDQQAVVSLIDISDPKGAIRRHAHFQTSGSVTDQFKMTYVNDEVAHTATFYGIFARRAWSSANCTGTSVIQNSLEAWDVMDGANPTRVGRLDFGKPNETVRGTAYDVSRKVVYAITAQQVDPLYAISIADPADLRILSAVDGLSGDMSVFRLIGNGNYLMAVGRDTSTTCTGYQDNEGRQGTKVAVSIIDVRDLAKVRLVQRQCVAVKNAGWSGSAVLTNLDQAHKMLGMYSDDRANVISVPVYYYTKSEDPDWWYYRYETAVGIMAWDLAKYDDTKSETEQTVLQNYGTFIHPKGQVLRSILFTHQGTGRRMMINLSDTHASLADVEDLSNPTQQSIIEIAPYYNQIYRFGDYLVEQVQTRQGTSTGDLMEFRVRKAGGNLDNVPPVATFAFGQVSRVIKHNDKLVLFRQFRDAVPLANSTSVSYQTRVEALVIDMANPESPRQAGKVTLSNNTLPYYPYWCGWDYYGAYWFSGSRNWIYTQDGLVMVSARSAQQPGTTTYATQWEVHTLDLTDADNPTEIIDPISVGSDYYGFQTMGDPGDPAGFYVASQTRAGQTVRDGVTYNLYRHYAQRAERVNGHWTLGERINLPGPLVQTWVRADGTRYFLTRENAYRRVQSATSSSYYYQYDVRLALLRQWTVDGKPVAELLDGTTFTNLTPSSMLVDSDRLYLTARQRVVNSSGSTPSWEETSDRFMVFDLSGNTLASAYDQPTKAYNLSPMGVNKGRMFVNLRGDGILVVDVSKADAPIGVQFLRTLGYATHLEAIGQDVYVASGYFGLSHLRLDSPADIPTL